MSKIENDLEDLRTAVANYRADVAAKRAAKASGDTRAYALQKACALDSFNRMCRLAGVEGL